MRGWGANPAGRQTGLVGVTGGAGSTGAGTGRRARGFAGVSPGRFPDPFFLAGRCTFRDADACAAVQNRTLAQIVSLCRRVRWITAVHPASSQPLVSVLAGRRWDRDAHEIEQNRCVRHFAGGSPGRRWMIRSHSANAHGRDSL